MHNFGSSDKICKDLLTKLPSEDGWGGGDGKAVPMIVRKRAFRLLGRVEEQYESALPVPLFIACKDGSLNLLWERRGTGDKLLVSVPVDVCKVIGYTSTRDGISVEGCEWPRIEYGELAGFVRSLVE